MTFVDILRLSEPSAEVLSAELSVVPTDVEPERVTAPGQALTQAEIDFLARHKVWVVSSEVITGPDSIDEIYYHSY